MAENGRESKRIRFEVLDGMRGVAAIFVLTCHLGIEKLYMAFPGSYLAVDLFFALSGFVLAHSYEQKLVDGMSPLAFMAQRFLRLYPLYLLGTALGVIYVLLLVLDGVGVSWHKMFATSIAGALFFPAPSELSLNPYVAFSLDYPAWSLFFELVANLAFAFLAPRFTTLRWLCLMAAGAIGLAVTAYFARSLDVGVASTWGDFGGALSRVTFSFVCGLLLYRVWRSGQLSWLKWPFYVPMLALIAIFAMPIFDPHRALFDAVCALTIFPALVLVGANAQVQGRILTMCSVLGSASYAFYVLQAPFINFADYFCRHAFGWSVAMMGLKGAGVAALTLFIFALIADTYYDTPLRQRLQRLIVKRAPLLAAPAKSNARVV